MVENIHHAATCILLIHVTWSLC